MPQNGQPPSGSLRVAAATPDQDGAWCRTQHIRRDIWLGMLPEAGDAHVPLYVESGEAVLAIAFLVPRTGKGVGGKLPAGSLCMFPPGTNRLPAVPGRGLLLCITAPRLAAILGPDADTLPERIRALLHRQENGAERIQVPLTPEQLLAGNALLNCPHEGAVRNMFFKSKILELLAFFFGQVATQERICGMAGLSPGERAVVARAREFLLGHMENPPAVPQIARHAGVNDTKLKRLFKEAYGLSPYAYLRAERLAVAREMLLAEGASVSEAAMAIGYSNVSHFIGAFTRRYGVRPGDLKPRSRRRAAG